MSCMADLNLCKSHTLTLSGGRQLLSCRVGSANCPAPRLAFLLSTKILPTPQSLLSRLTKALKPGSKQKLVRKENQAKNPGSLGFHQTTYF